MIKKHKRKLVIFAKISGLLFFVLLFFLNIKVGLINDSEFSKGDLSLLGLEIKLFEATSANGEDGGDGGSRRNCCRAHTCYHFSQDSPYGGENWSFYTIYGECYDGTGKTSKEKWTILTSGSSNQCTLFKSIYTTCK